MFGFTPRAFLVVYSADILFSVFHEILFFVTSFTILEHHSSLITDRHRRSDCYMKTAHKFQHDVLHSKCRAIDFSAVRRVCLCAHF